MLIWLTTEPKMLLPSCTNSTVGMQRRGRFWMMPFLFMLPGFVLKI